MMASIRVLIVDDHPLIRYGMRSLFANSGDIVTLAEAENGFEAINLAEALKPDVVIMDLRMPDIGGVEATRRIVEIDPGAKVLVLSLFEDDDSIFAALRAGARGYVLKDANEKELLLAIRAIHAGDVIFGGSIANRLLAYFSRPKPTAAAAFPDLSSRERQLLHLMARGKSNQEIADALCISCKTVRNYISNILNKLQVTDRAQAIQLARGAGLGDQ